MHARNVGKGEASDRVTRLKSTPRAGRPTHTWDFENKLILSVSPLLARVT